VTEELIRVLICRVEQQPTVEDVPNKFETWQKLVAAGDQSKGYVEFIRLSDDVVMIANEDGSYICPQNCYVPGLAPNVSLKDFDFVVGPRDMPPPGELGVHKTYGTIIIAKHTGNHQQPVSITEEEAELWKRAIKFITDHIESET